MKEHSETTTIKAFNLAIVSVERLKYVCTRKIKVYYNTLLRLTPFLGDWVEFWGVKSSSFAVYNQR